MEFFLFLGLAFAGVVLFLWRSRTRTTRDAESLTKGLPDDLRNKHDGMRALPNRGRPWGRGN
jgi:cbb3-type cytochrome oxidase subunit 3